MAEGLGIPSLSSTLPACSSTRIVIIDFIGGICPWALAFREVLQGPSMVFVMKDFVSLCSMPASGFEQTFLDCTGEQQTLELITFLRVHRDIEVYVGDSPDGSLGVHGGFGS